MQDITKGQVISGNFGNILVREKADKKLELGELLIADTKEGKILLQVFDLMYGSQISQQNLELISGMKLEDETDVNFLDRKLRNYILAQVKSLVTIKQDNAKIAKTLPMFFSVVNEITKDDLKFLTTPPNPMLIGNLRSGSKVLDVPIYLNGKDVFSHHILIPATTGRGKSNLTSVILWDTLDKDYCGILVLDPHDEYYGRNKTGLKDHPKKEFMEYYTPKDPPPGTKTLKINISQIKPWHFDGVYQWSDPQKEALAACFKKYGDNWIKNIIENNELEGFGEATIAVLKRRLLQILGISTQDFECKGVFDFQQGQTTIQDIVNELESGKTVIIDTSNFSGKVEILVGSLITSEIFNRYKFHKSTGQLKDKPVISIVLEEAPRVLGKDVLEKSSNIFETIAREGRKFKVGLTAITQLPSLIPREILANMNTKIVLGVEMKPERQAIIESASQDLSEDDRNIASLDKGEALITSNFARFATPIKVPLFEDYVKQQKERAGPETTKDYSGITN